MHKKLLTVFALLLGSVLSVFAQQERMPDIIQDAATMEAKIHSARMHQVSGAGAGYDLKYHRCVWNVDPAVADISGNVTSYFMATTALGQVTFDLNDAMQVDSVQHAGANLSFSHAGNVLTITLSSAVPAGTLDSLTVFYHGTPSSGGFGSFIQDTHAGAPIVWTLSEPYGAMDWWPCKQDLNDKIDSVEVFVTAPLGNRVGSNGLLLSVDTAGANTVHHWKTRYPIAAYLVAIAVTNYSAFSNWVPMQNNDSLEVLNYVYPEDLATAQVLAPSIIEIIQLFDSLTIPYPFAEEKYGHAQFNWGGGMEHQTMTFIAGLGYALMAHECAHQWFGDRVTCGSWEDIWLNEGFATYFEGLTVQRYFPANWMNWKMNKIASVTSSAGGSVRCVDTTSLWSIFDGRLSYNKGAYVLHMLRWVLGDQQFFQGLKNYLNDPQLAYGYARTSDLKFHLEQVSGLNLTGFFQQWYNGQGYPSYNLTLYPHQNSADIVLSQTTSHPSVPFYEMPVPVQLTDGIYDTIVVLQHSYSGQVFHVNLPFTPVTAFVDPELWILSANNQVTVGLNESALTTSGVYIFPNPAREFLQWEAGKVLTGTGGLYSMDGKEVKSFPVNEKSGRVDVSSLESGVYMLKIRSVDGVFTRKVQVVR